MGCSDVQHWPSECNVDGVSSGNLTMYKVICLGSVKVTVSNIV